MKCPECGNSYTRVSNTDHRDHRTRRCRACPECGCKFRTTELHDNEAIFWSPPKRANSGRGGEQNSQAVLTTENVRQLRKEFANGETRNSLARRYGIARATVSDIVTGRTWKAV